jgi:hypothetical protein
MDNKQKAYELSLAAKNAVQMLRTNISAIRYAIVMNKPQMVVEIINEMDKTVSELELKVRKSN